jgi:AHBA synthesis associated protein
MVRAIVFDLDGVLVDTIEVTRRAFEAAYRACVGSGPAPFEEYRSHLGRFFPDILRAMGLPLEMEPVFVRESQRLGPCAPVFDGVPRVLRELDRRGIRMGVATGKAGYRARTLLEQKGLLSWLPVVVGGDEVARCKPAPDMVLAVARRLRVDAKDALMVGDSVLDLRAGRGAETQVAAALWGDGCEAELRACRPDHLLRRPEDVLAVVEESCA